MNVTSQNAAIPVAKANATRNAPRHERHTARRRQKNVAKQNDNVWVKRSAASRSAVLASRRRVAPALRSYTAETSQRAMFQLHTCGYSPSVNPVVAPTPTEDSGSSRLRNQNVKTTAIVASPARPVALRVVRGAILDARRATDHGRVA